MKKRVLVVDDTHLRRLLDWGYYWRTVEGDGQPDATDQELVNMIKAKLR